MSDVALQRRAGGVVMGAYARTAIGVATDHVALGAGVGMVLGVPFAAPLAVAQRQNDTTPKTRGET